MPFLQVKKVKLRRENDGKILREVNTLSRLSHSHIVRYYTVTVHASCLCPFALNSPQQTWLETAIVGLESPYSSQEVSADGSELSSPSGTVNFFNGDDEEADLFRIDDLSLVAPAFSPSSTSFPSIRFGRDSNSHSYEEEDDDSEDDNEKGDDDDDDDDDSSGGGTPGQSISQGSPLPRRTSRHVPLPKRAPQVLYIQMVSTATMGQDSYSLQLRSL